MELTEQLKNAEQNSRTFDTQIERINAEITEKQATADKLEKQSKELQDKLQKMTDRYIKDMEKLMDEKSKEIMKV